MNYKRLGDYIQQVNVRNTALEVDTLLGVSITKKLIPSIANTIGTDMSVYKIIERQQFAYGTVTSRNGDKISIALADEHDQALVSQIYVVFEVIDKDELLPEYLMMWFSRPEFDRYARYHSHGSTRETFDWDDMCEVQLPIPSIDKQRAIVAEYQSIENKIAINNQICEKLETTAQALYRHWFVDFEFPNEEGKPYKSSGDAMVYNEELEKEIPEGWEVGSLGELFIFQRGHDLPAQDRILGMYPIFASTGIAEYHNEFKINKPTIITGRSGSLGELHYYDKPCWPLNTSLYIIEFRKSKPFFALYLLQRINLKELGSGSAVPTLNRNDIHSLASELPNLTIIILFDNMVSKSYALKEHLNTENQELTLLQSLLLSRLAKQL